MKHDDPIAFEAVTFSYPPEEEGEEALTIFDSLSLSIPSGVTTLVGPNGVGKTTFMLLAGARLMPDSGRVLLLGEETSRFGGEPSPEREAERNQLASFIYQNMEFETEEPVGELLGYVLEAGNHGEEGSALRADIEEALELRDCLDRRTQELSKGELQRIIIAFSLLYGSRAILMDEPVFALEEPQKDRVFSFLMEYARQRDLTVLYSAHNIDLSAKYSDQTLLFSKEGTVTLGPTPEVFTRENLESAFQAPYDTLYQRQSLYRDVLYRMSSQE